MNCKRHPENSAVAQCSECGAGVCKECAEVTYNAREYFGTLCLDCYADHVKEAIYSQKEKAKKLTRRIKGKSFFYMLGLICFALAGLSYVLPLSEALESLTGNVELYQPLVGLGVFLCGVYSAIAGWQMGTDAHHETEEKMGATYNVYSDGTVIKDQGIGLRLFGFVLGLIFGVITTPFSILSDKNSKRDAERSIEFFENELEEIENL